MATLQMGLAAQIKETTRALQQDRWGSVNQTIEMGSSCNKPVWLTISQLFRKRASPVTEKDREIRWFINLNSAAPTWSSFEWSRVRSVVAHCPAISTTWNSRRSLQCIWVEWVMRWASATRLLSVCIVLQPRMSFSNTSDSRIGNEYNNQVGKRNLD